MNSPISKETSAGVLHNVVLQNTRIYNIFTKSENYRGGKIYDQDKFFTIISGSCELIIYDGEKDIKTLITPGNIHKIDENTPNIFYFPEDTEMLEWFSQEAKAVKYERYRELKK